MTSPNKKLFPFVKVVFCDRNVHNLEDWLHVSFLWDGILNVNDIFNALWSIDFTICFLYKTTCDAAFKNIKDLVANFEDEIAITLRTSLVLNQGATSKQLAQPARPNNDDCKGFLVDPLNTNAFHLDSAVCDDTHNLVQMIFCFRLF